MGIITAMRGHGPERGTLKGAVDGGEIWWVAPNYSTLVASKAWAYAKKATEHAGATVSEKDKQILLPGGGSLTVRSADSPIGLRGPGLDGVIIDEAAFLPVSVWHEALRPALADKRGWAILCSTPNGRNWFWDEWKRRDEHSQSWQLPSSDNPIIRQDELEDIKRRIGPRKFAQEHEAQFLEVEGAMWPGSYFDDIYADLWPDAFEWSAIAVDPSVAKSDLSDYSAIVFAGVSGGRYWIDCEIRRRPPGELVVDIVRWWLRYNPGVLGIEANGFQAVLRELVEHYAVANNYVVPIRLIDNREKKEQRVQRLDPLLATGKIRVRPTQDGETLVEQLMMFPLKDYHDDGPDALEMAIRLVTEQVRGPVEVGPEMVLS